MPRALREAKRIDRQNMERIRAAIERYAETEHGDVAKLKGYDPPEWRLRVGDWRVRFIHHPDDEEVLVVMHVRHRREAYR